MLPITVIAVEADSSMVESLQGVARRFGWKLDLFDPESGRPRDRKLPRVGLVLLARPGSAIRRAEVEKCLQWPDMRWIGVVNETTWSSSEMVALLSHKVFDFSCIDQQGEALRASIEAAMQDLANGPTCIEVGQHEAYPLLGVSPPMHRLRRRLRKIASAEAPLVILGESGSGKEAFARAVHRFSSRSDKPFIAVDCGAIPDSLVQSRLFGHEKGAFTGALQPYRGAIQSADGGILFLDKVDNFPLHQQVNLLRFLQEGLVDPVGSTVPVPVNVRVIVSAGEPLSVAVKEGRFRADLFYRLNVLRLELPPLRERGKDIELLAGHFLHEFSRTRASRPHPAKFCSEALGWLKHNAWTGNVRELANRIKRACVMADSEQIRLADLGVLPELVAGVPTLAEARAQAEREVIVRSLGLCGANISRASRLLDISRLSLYRLMEKHNLERSQVV